MYERCPISETLTKENITVINMELITKQEIKLVIYYTYKKFISIQKPLIWSHKFI